MNGILWVLRTHAAWRDLPARYGPWQTAYMRLRRWRADGRLGEIIERLGLDLTSTIGMGILPMNGWRMKTGLMTRTSSRSRLELLRNHRAIIP